MDCTTRTFPLVVAVIGLALILPAASASPTPADESADESGEKCADVIRGEHHGDDVHVDIYVSDVRIKDGRLYVNGEQYPKYILNRLEKAYGHVSDNGSDLIDPDHPNHPVHPGGMNPVVNPILDALLGPFQEFIDDLDEDDLPTVEVGIRMPTPSEDPPGVHLRVILNLQVCSEPQG